jgi:molybdenum cofactor guanylyltransferase
MLLHGLVLSGGESRRMGQDKGLIRSGEGTWANRAARLLAAAGLPVSVGVRPAQLEAYAQVLDPAFDLLPDADLPLGGPLRGLLSAHLQQPEADWLVLPCDLPDMTSEVLFNLISFYKTTPAATAWVYQEAASQRLQPLPGIYSARLLAQVLELVQRQELGRFSLKYLLEPEPTGTLPLPDHLLPAFRNCNAPSDRDEPA